MVKKLKINEWIVLGIVALILFGSAFALGMSIDNKKIDINEINNNNLDNLNYTFDEYTRVDVCKTGCNVMDLEYTKDFELEHNNNSSDIDGIIERYNTCYSFCEDSYN